MTFNGKAARSAIVLPEEWRTKIYNIKATGVVVNGYTEFELSVPAMVHHPVTGPYRCWKLGLIPEHLHFITP